MSRYKSKIALFIISLFVTFATTELVLRLIVKKTNEPKFFYQIKEYELNEKEYSGTESYKRDYSSEIYKSSNRVELTLFGDSFTNGGNVLWDDTYPYQLFQSLEKRVTVRNMGVCSNTTRQSLDVFKKFLASKEFHPDSKNMAIFMIGAADNFSSDLNKPIAGIELEEINWVNMESLLYKRKIVNFFDSLIFLKVIRLTYGDLISRISNSLYSYNKYDDFIKSMAICDTLQYKGNCIYEVYKSHKTNEVEKDDLKEYLVIKYLSDKRVTNSSGYEILLQDYLTIIKNIPTVISRSDFLMNVLKITQYQNSIPLSEVRNVLLSQLNYIEDNKSRDVVENLLETFEKWQNNQDEMRSQILKTWDEIVRLANSNNVELILMTYPADYKLTNQLIREVAKMYKLRLIDLDASFEKIGNRHLDDWEHSTSEGYKLMAQLISSDLKNEILEVK